jgi:mannitol/fructose-specific phosphotransferase system IIA component (Ntr-type)
MNIGAMAAGRDGQWENRMDLPEDIRLKIEANTDKETILEVVNRLQSDGVVITHDVFAAIQATLDLTNETIE